MNKNQFTLRPCARILARVCGKVGAVFAFLALVAFAGMTVHAQDTNWKSLFNSRDLDGWVTNDYAGGGEV